MEIIGNCDSCKALVNILYQMGKGMVCENCYELIKDAIGDYDEDDQPDPEEFYGLV